MKKRLFLLCAVICTALAFLPSAPSAGADSQPAIHVSEKSEADGVCSFLLNLSGSEMDGTVLVAVYSEDGRMKQFESYEAASSVRVTLRGTTEAERVQSIWVKDNFAPVAFADTVFPQNIAAKSYEEFSNAVADMVRSYKPRDVDKLDTVDKYASARLIVGCKETLPDLSGYPYIRKIHDMEGHTILQFASPDEAKACAEYLAGRLPQGSYVEPDARFFVNPMESEEPAGDTADNTLSWGTPIIHASQRAQNLKRRGILSAVTVAVVDSGVDNTHAFLEGRVVSGYDYVDDDDTPNDEHSHGTHVAGIIVDCTPGLSVNIMPVRVMDESGGGNTLNISAGIRYAADHGADVINLSIGGELSNFIDEAVQYAISKNIIVVAAAGNEKQDVSNSSPAHLAECITVSAVDKNLKPYSRSNFGEGVDLAAPGVDIKSCVPGGSYHKKGGTSMAAPHVTACVAMLRSEFPSLTPAQAQEQLVSTAQRPPDWDEKYGAGVVDMREVSEQLYAILYADGGLSFQSDTTPQAGRTAQKVYETDSGGYQGGVYAAWYEEREQILSVDFAVAVYPTSTALWFYGCKNLSEITNAYNLYTDFVTDMSQMFSYCSALTSLDLSGFVTDNVVNAAGMFYGCAGLVSIYASGTFSTEQLTDSREMFYDCTSLVGGAGTKYDSNHVDKEYARIDGGLSAPGYFTLK